MLIAEALAQFAHETRTERMPATVRIRAKHLILDAVGCALAARREAFVRAPLAALAELGGRGDSAVIGHDIRLPLRDAVLMNGLLCHGLDYDDTHLGGVLHLTVSVLPAVLGVAAERNASGSAMLDAYIVGVEAGARIASVAKGGFHQIGFHPTGLVGAFACALAAGRLYGLGEHELMMAQGIALSVASGSLEFLQDGSGTKRMHPGWAGVGGITAAMLAKHGFSAPAAAYEGRFGLFRSHLGAEHDKADYTLATRALGEQWETMNVAVKPFPACHLLHACADAAIALHREGVRPQDVAAVMARVPREVVQTVCEPIANKRRPANDYDAKFSVPYAVAAGLVRGRFGLAELEPDALCDPALLALAAQVSYEIDADNDFPRVYPGEVVVTLRDGRVVRKREAVNRGAADRPITNQEVEEKFFDNATLVVPRERASEIRDAVLALDASPARAIAEVLGR